jgi:hypothetical protein
MNTKPTTVAAALAARLEAKKNFGKFGAIATHAQRELFDKHTEALWFLRREFLPSGSGFDSGTELNETSSGEDMLLFTTSFHHMNESGYTGWTEHTVRVYPRFDSGLKITVTGRNTNDIMPYIVDTFRASLEQKIVANDDGVTYTRAPDPELATATTVAAAPKTFDGMTRYEILKSFGYAIVHRGEYFVGLIVDDPDAFLVVCGSEDEAERESYESLLGSADPAMYTLPDFE